MTHEEDAPVEPDATETAGPEAAGPDSVAPDPAAAGKVDYVDEADGLDENGHPKFDPAKHAASWDEIDIEGVTYNEDGDVSLQEEEGHGKVYFGDDAYRRKLIEPPAETAVVLHKYDRRRGRELLDESEALKELTLGRDKDEAGDAIADFVGCLFHYEPRLHEKCIPEGRRDFLARMMETPEFRELHARTMFNDFVSEVACISVATQYAELVKKNGEDFAKAKKDGKGKRDWINEAKIDRAIAGAVKKASEEAKEADDWANGIGGMGADHNKMSTKEAVKQFHKIRNSPSLKKIMGELGRYIAVAKRQQARKSMSGSEQIRTLGLTTRIDRILPSELGMMFTGDKWSFLYHAQRMVEGQMLGHIQKSKMKGTSGPIVIVVDESGSMSCDTKIVQAKALALALGYIARSQKRWCAFVSFSGGTEGVWEAFPPNNWDQVKLLAWLEHFYGGGTDLDVPIKELPKKYWPEMIKKGLPRGNTDIVCITDAEVRAPDKMVKDFLAWKKEENVRMTSFIVGCGDPGDMKKVSDTVHVVDKISADSKEVNEVLSI